MLQYDAQIGICNVPYLALRRLLMPAALPHPEWYLNHVGFDVVGYLVFHRCLEGLPGQSSWKDPPLIDESTQAALFGIPKMPMM